MNMTRLTHISLHTITAALLTLVVVLSPGILQAQKLPVVVSIIPQQYFVERIAGEFAEVSVMVQPGASPATYEPKPRQMAALQNARLYLAIGVPFEEAWLPRIQAANPAMRVVDITTGIQKLPMEAHHHEGATPQPQPQPQPDHDGLDPHVWLSPMLVKHMAQTIKNELVRSDPPHAAQFRANYALLEKELDDLDRELNDIFTAIPAEKRVFMVFHPSWGYFAMNYSLTQIPIEYEGKEPTPRILAEMMEHAATQHIRTIFIQPQFSRKSAEAIAAHIHGKVVIADPLAYDWFANLRSVSRDLAATFTQ